MPTIAEMIATRATEDIESSKFSVDTEITDIETLIKIIQAVNAYNEEQPDGINLLYINVNSKFLTEAKKSAELMSLLANSKLQGICVTFTDQPSLNPHDPVVAMQVINMRTDFQQAVSRLRASTQGDNYLPFGLYVPKDFKAAYDTVLDVSEGKFAEKFFNLYWKQYWINNVNQSSLPPQTIQRILLTDRVDLRTLFKDDYARIEASKTEFVRIVNETFAESFAFLRATKSEDQIPVMQKIVLENLINGSFSRQQDDPNNLFVITPAASLRTEIASSYVQQTEARKARNLLATAVRNFISKYTMNVPLHMRSGLGQVVRPRPDF